MSEWLKVPVLKTGIPGKVSGVRILLHPYILNNIRGGLTQLVEYLAYNEAVSGSSPLTPNALLYRKKASAGMVELVDTLDLGSRGSNLAGSSPATRIKVRPTHSHGEYNLNG